MKNRKIKSIVLLLIFSLHFSCNPANSDNNEMLLVNPYNFIGQVHNDGIELIHAISLDIDNDKDRKSFIFDQSISYLETKNFKYDKEYIIAIKNKLLIGKDPLFKSSVDSTILTSKIKPFIERFNYLADTQMRNQTALDSARQIESDALIYLSEEIRAPVLAIAAVTIHSIQYWEEYHSNKQGKIKFDHQTQDWRPDVYGALDGYSVGLTGCTAFGPFYLDCLVAGILLSALVTSIMEAE